MDNRKNNCVELSRGRDYFLDDILMSDEVASRNEKVVAIFGGGAITCDSLYYTQAEKLASLISNAGISIVTGGGPGIMEAGNKGAKLSKSNASSYGLKVSYIKKEILANNQYIDGDCDFTFNTLSVRLLTLLEISDAVVLFPGGYGTLQELFSLVVRIKINMMRKIPVYLFGSDFWDGLVRWLNDVVKKEGVIGDEHIAIFKIEDDVEKISSEIIDSLS